MKKLNDKEWDQVQILIDSRMTRWLKGQRDSNALAAVGYLQEPKHQIDIARYYAGYASAMHKAQDRHNSMMADLEELLHPVYDDERRDQGYEDA